MHRSICSPHGLTRGLCVTPILSVVLPVQNREASLARQVQQLLDFLPELTAHFELVVVDNGSTDQTGDVAREMARQYPQMSVVSLAEAQPAAAAAKRGIARSQGEVVLIQEEDAPLRTADYRKLWALRSDKSLVMARSTPQQPAIDGKVIDRLVQWGHAMRTSAAENPGQGGIQMIRRAAAEELCDLDHSPSQLVHEYASNESPAAPSHQANVARPRRPLVNFLQHLRGLTPVQS